MKKPTVLVIGSTGRLGQVIVKKLMEKNIPLRIMLRKDNDTQKFNFDVSSLDIIYGNINIDEDIASACENCDAVISVQVNTLLMPFLFYATS
jgi:uncharacterized protein YbjT (DUF2867 family)